MKHSSDTRYDTQTLEGNGGTTITNAAFSSK